MQLFDTNILIDIQKSRDPAVTLFMERPVGAAISVLTIQELFSGARANETDRIDQLIGSFVVIDVDATITRLSGEWLKQFRKSHRLDPNDTVIAATARAGGYELLTLNLKHFPMFPTL